MNEKLTLDDLSNYIMLKHNITKEESDRFLAGFLKVIGEGLICDRYVRIKGLGTFKLIENNIDINNSFGNIVFVPESYLKDAVNKPFAHFESTILNDNVSFDDIDEHVLPDNCVASAEEYVNSDSAGTGNSSGDLSNNTDNDSDIRANDIDSRNYNKPLDRMSNSDKTIRSEDRSSYISHNQNIRWYVIATLFIGFILGVTVSWLVFDNKLLETDEKKISSNSVTESVDIEFIDETVTMDSLTNSEISVDYVTEESGTIEKNEIDSLLKIADIVKKENKKEDINVYSAKHNYRIVGTIESHVIKKGNTLAKIAYKYYKNKSMWPYIVMYNKEKIKDPNNIPVDTEINIPKLEVIE